MFCLNLDRIITLNPVKKLITLGQCCKNYYSEIYYLDYFLNNFEHIYGDFLSRINLTICKKCNVKNSDDYSDVVGAYSKIDSTVACNINCAFCHMKKTKMKSFIEYEDFLREYDRIIFDMICEYHKKNNLELNFVTSCFGEPFIYFEDLLYKSTKVNKLSITTNGMLATPENIDKLRNNTETELIMSICSTSKEDFERLEIGANFDTVINNALYAQSVNCLRAINVVRAPEIEFKSMQEIVKSFREFGLNCEIISSFDFVDYTKEQKDKLIEEDSKFIENKLRI